ncbi:transposase [Streptomyces sp. NPDC001933]|uniref:transposase n=1 Tax=Streptomyces sp. NPDC001933 TaxID=3364626 RepID=UPI0036CC0971
MTFPSWSSWRPVTASPAWAFPPVELLGRMRSDRVLYFPPTPQPYGKRGRKPKRGPEFKFEDVTTWPAPAITTATETTRYGLADTMKADANRHAP